MVDFINANGNILLTLSSTHTIPTSVVSLLLELGIEVPSDRTGTVVDHFSYDILSSPSMHDVLVLPAPGKYKDDVKDFFTSSKDNVIAFPRGVAQTLGSSPLLAPILRAPRTAYSYNPKDQADGIEGSEELFATGSQLSLVTTMQARNSARFTVVGSAEMLSDTWAESKVQMPGSKEQATAANRDFAKRIAGWTFQEIGVLKVNWIEHRLVEEGIESEPNPKIYRINNQVVCIHDTRFVRQSYVSTNFIDQVYSISLSEYSWDKWVPFTLPDADALQLEFSMLSPFHRLPLQPLDMQNTSSTYGVTFKLPDQHGIFNFKVNYKRPFLTNIEEKITVSVRHMAHDEWPRSYVITGAWPWIGGVAATVTGWLAFCALWLYSAPAKIVVEGKKTQ